MRHLFLLRIPHFPIQASDDTPQEGTFERKISRSQKIRDAYPKTIIAKTGHETTGRNDIRLIDLARWLMGQAYTRSANGAAKAIPGAREA